MARFSLRHLHDKLLLLDFFFISLEEWFETSFSLNSGSCSVILRGWLNSEWNIDLYHLACGKFWRSHHCVKSVCVRSYSIPRFPAFRLNTDTFYSEYGLFLHSVSSRLSFDKIIHTILKLNSAIISVLKSSYVCCKFF